jgi:ATP-dependent Clp protease adaptor protein ClpS
MSAVADPPAPKTSPQTAPPKRQPPYNVILVDDEAHSKDFVILVIQKVFGFCADKAAKLASEAEEHGRALLWTGTRELAELKQEQMQAERENGDIIPLTVEIEPAI